MVYGCARRFVCLLANYIFVIIIIISGQYLSTWSSSADTDGIPDPLPGKQSFWDTPSLLADHARIE